MKKRIIALLLACCFVFAAAPVYAGAATGQQVTAGAVTVTAGNTATVTLKAENFAGVAALDVYLYYDAAVFTVSSTSNGSLLTNAQASVNTATAGEIKLSTMALEGMNGSGSLLTVRFAVSGTATPDTYPITVAIGRAYDTTLQPVAVGSAGGSITVTKPVQTETFTIYGNADRSTLQKGDMLTYRVRSSSSSRAFVSGEFTLNYDHELFAFDSAVLESALTGEGAIYSVNSSVLGQVRIAYANEDPVNSYYLFTVKLTVIANVDTTTTVTAKATNMYREDLSAYLPDDYVSTLTLTKLPEVTDHPDAFLRTDRLVVGEQSKSVFTLEAGAGVAAADFRITYDPAVLRCLGVSKSEETDAMVIINDHVSDGAIRFSYVNAAQPAEEQTILEILWEPIQSPATHYQTTLSGVGVVDSQQTAVELEYVTDSGCIYEKTVTEPTRQEDGSADYRCSCGEGFSEVLPAIPNPAAQQGTTLYATLPEALEKASADSTLQLLQSDSAAQLVEKSLILDLNGFDLTGEITVSEGCTLTVLDSQTEDYTVEDDAFGYGLLAEVSGNVIAADGYIAVTEADGLSFHRVALEITDMVLRPSAAGVYYKSAFSGDEIVARQVSRYGVALSVQGAPNAENPGICSWHDAFTSGSVASGTLLKGIMKTKNSEDANASNAEMEVYGRAYILTNDGQYIFGDTVSRSLRQQVELIDAQWATLDEAQKAGLLELYRTYEAAMNTWQLPNISNAA